MINRIHIYDLDGTIVSSSHRYRALDGEIDLDYWRANNIPNKIRLDSLLPHAAQYKTDVANPAIYTIIATARLCNNADGTYKFIRERLGFPDKFIHRKPEHGSLSGATLKIRGIKPLLNLKQFRGAEVHVWEDNASYLSALETGLGAVGHFVPSTQGH